MLHSYVPGLGGLIRWSRAAGVWQQLAGITWPVLGMCMYYQKGQKKSDFLFST